MIISPVRVPRQPLVTAIRVFSWTTCRKPLFSLIMWS